MFWKEVFRVKYLLLATIVSVVFLAVVAGKQEKKIKGIENYIMERDQMCIDFSM